jgi:hypothetical protein
MKIDIQYAKHHSHLDQLYIFGKDRFVDFIMLDCPSCGLKLQITLVMGSLLVLHVVMNM